MDVFSNNLVNKVEKVGTRQPGHKNVSLSHIAAELLSTVDFQQPYQPSAALAELSRDWPEGLDLEDAGGQAIWRDRRIARLTKRLAEVRRQIEKARRKRVNSEAHYAARNLPADERQATFRRKVENLEAEEREVLTRLGEVSERRAHALR